MIFVNAACSVRWPVDLRSDTAQENMSRHLSTGRSAIYTALEAHLNRLMLVSASISYLDFG